MKQFNPRLSAALVVLAMTSAPLVTASPVMASGEAARAPARAEDTEPTLVSRKVAGVCDKEGISPGW